MAQTQESKSFLQKKAFLYRIQQMSINSQQVLSFAKN